MSHLAIAELLAYQDPSIKPEERDKLKKHMQSCEKCRERFISVQSLETAVRQSMQGEKNLEVKITEDCVPTEVMGDFLGGRLTDNEQAFFTDHAVTCDSCFERAAYFSASTVKMTEGVLKMSPTPQHFIEAVSAKPTVQAVDTNIEPSITKSIQKWFFSPVPAYAFAGLLLIFVVTGSGGGDGIVEVDSNNMFTVYEKPAQSGPSFGFSGGVRKKGEVPANLKVQMENSDKLRFSWNKISEASGYNFHVTVLDSTGHEVIYDTQTTDNEVYTPLSLFTRNKAYQWKVTGSYETGDLFSAIGQFVYVD